LERLNDNNHIPFDRIDSAGIFFVFGLLCQRKDFAVATVRSRNNKGRANVEKAAAEVDRSTGFKGALVMAVRTRIALTQRSLRLLSLAGSKLRWKYMDYRSSLASARCEKASVALVRHRDCSWGNFCTPPWIEAHLLRV